MNACTWVMVAGRFWPPNIRKVGSDGFHSMRSVAAHGGRGDDVLRELEEGDARLCATQSQGLVGSRLTPKPRGYPSSP